MLRRRDLLLPLAGAVALLLGLALAALALRMDPASDLPRRYAEYVPLEAGPPAWLAPTGWTVAACGLLLLVVSSTVLLVRRARRE